MKYKLLPKKDFAKFQKMCQHTSKVRKAIEINANKNKIPPRWVMKELFNQDLEFSIKSFKEE